MTDGWKVSESGEAIVPIKLTAQVSLSDHFVVHHFVPLQQLHVTLKAYHLLIIFFSIYFSYLDQSYFFL